MRIYKGGNDGRWFMYRFDAQYFYSAVASLVLLYIGIEKLGSWALPHSWKETRKGKEKIGRKRDDDVLIPVVYLLPIK
jgi:hypothetical protein